MGLLDWFVDRPAQFDTDRLSDAMTLQAVDKAVSLINPRLKLLRAYQDRLAPAVQASVCYLRELVRAVPPAIDVAAAQWSAQPALRAFFSAPVDVPIALGRSQNLRTLFDKYPGLDAAYLMLGMKFAEQRVGGMTLRGEVLQREVLQNVATFSGHQARICGHEESEVRRLLGAQAFEYLVAQALAEIGEERSERHELEDNRSLIRARLRLLQQQGPGFGSLFGSAPQQQSSEQRKLEAALLENERQMEAVGSAQSVLDAELDCLRLVLEHPERYLSIEQKHLSLSTMNVILDQKSGDVAGEVVFSLAQLVGRPEMSRAFVLARIARDELPKQKINFDDAARYL